MKISISNIKGYFPDGYSEQLYIDSSKHRLRLDGQDIVIFNTPTKHRVKNDNSYRNRKVQSVFYNKYVLDFFITESTNIDLLSVAETVTVTLDDGEIHKAELLDVPTAELVQDSTFKKITLTYRDLNSKVTVNHLEVTNLTDGIASFKSGLTTVYTPIYCKFDVTDYEKTENADNGITLVSSDNAFRVIKFFAYVSDTVLETIKRGLSAVYDFEIVYDGTIYEALEVPEIELIEDDFEGIKGIEVTLKYEQILNYPFVEQVTDEITISVSNESLIFTLEDESVIESIVTTNSPSGWFISNVSATWITAFKSGDNIKISVSTSTENRTGSVELSALDDTTKTATISITQAGSEITIEPSVLYFELVPGFSQTAVVTTANPTGWEITNVSATWITATKDGNNLVIEVFPNPTPRTGSVTVNNVGATSETAILYINQGE